MRRDAIFYQIFQRFPTVLFELVNNPPRQAAEYRFESVEIKEPNFRIDGIFLPPENAVPKVVFFAEVQFQKDNSLYHRFFAEAFLYLYRNPTLYDDWAGVLIYGDRTLEPDNGTIHRALLESPQVTRIYLNELAAAPSPSLGLSLMQLTIAPPDAAIAQARHLIARTQQEAPTPPLKTEIIDMIATIAVYKFTHLSREEVETMLGLNLEESRIYQEAKAEGKAEGLAEGKAEILAVTVPLLLRAGMTIEQIAQTTQVEIDLIRQIVQPSGD